MKASFIPPLLFGVVLLTGAVPSAAVASGSLRGHRSTPQSSSGQVVMAQPHVSHGVVGGSRTARGVTAPASMETAPRPVNLAPPPATLTQQGTKLTPSDESGAGYAGSHLAMSSDGTTAVVGGAGDSTAVGGAWIFVHSTTGWSQQGQELVPSDTTGLANFGESVAISADGNTVLIGGSLDNHSTGAAWVFTRSKGTWTQQVELTSTGDTPATGFAFSLALSGDGKTALIGAPTDNDGVGDVWIFTGSGTRWTLQTELIPDVPKNDDVFFGFSVAVSSDGNTAIIGESGYFYTATVFFRVGSTWTQTAKLPSGGWSVAVSADGKTALVGDSYRSTAFVYTLKGSTWSQFGQPLLGNGQIPPGPGYPSEYYGNSVALSADGSSALIGAYGDSNGIGAAWLFTRRKSGFTQSGAKLTANDEAGADNFGAGLSLSADASSALIGGPLDSNNTGAFWSFVMQPSGIAGAILRGSQFGVPSNPAVPVGGVSVSISGTTAAGKHVTFSTTTARDGTYQVSAPQGHYAVTFPKNVCAVVPGKRCVQSGHVTVKATVARLDAVAVIGVLQVTVKLNPRQLTLDLDPATGKNVPKPLDVTVTVKNTGKAPVDAVTAPPKLAVSYDTANAPHVPQVPLRPKSGPAPKANLGTITPGGSVMTTYVLSAEGDGKYDIEALVIGDQPGITRIAGVGAGNVLVGAPIFVMSAKIGKEVHSPDRPSLVKAGTALTINLTVTNLSYVNTVALEPYYPDLTGNAFDGHIQLKDQPIQQVSGMAAVQPSPWVQLDPRESFDFESVVRTTSTPADVLVGEKQTGGGTRAVVTLPDPKVYHVTEAGELGDQLESTDVFVDGDNHYEISLDDSDFRTPPPPSTYVGALWYFSKGAMIGAWNLTAGGLAQLCATLPDLVKGGITAVNAGLVDLMTTEMELWGEVKDNPALLGSFLSLVGNETMLTYKLAPKLVKNAGEFEQQAEKSVLDGYTKIWNDWYSGDWTDAMTEFGREGTERTGDLAMALAPGLLVRDARVLEAFTAAKARIYAQVTEDLAAYAPKLVDAFESVAALKNVLKAGFEMSDTPLRQFFGLTVEQSDWLRDFAKTNELLIVVRSRAAESIRWIKRFGAVLKPEAIKIKNVSWLDSKYLGFAESDIGRVVIRQHLPTESEVEVLLRKYGFGPADAEWQEAIARLDQRTEELTKAKDGYLPYLEKASKDGYIDMNFNLADNVVDPTAYTKGAATRYEFRLADYEGSSTFKRKCVAATQNCIPQFYVNGKWRSITGDVDFLQITKANGAELSDAERVALYKQISKSPLGFMHPESATWTDLKNNAFSFGAKLNEFKRAGMCAQFAPDSVARAVLFDPATTDFISKSNYRIGWTGGYVNPLGAVAP